MAGRDTLQIWGTVWGPCGDRVVPVPPCACMEACARQGSTLSAAGGKGAFAHCLASCHDAPRMRPACCACAPHKPRLLRLAQAATATACSTVNIAAVLAGVVFSSRAHQRRDTLPTIFSSDEAVQQLVLSAALPAAVMLGLGWNNALEGCLLAAEEQPYVVRMYPCAVAAALLQLARGYWADAGLPAVWMALMTYYLVLLVGFAGRYWVFRGKL